MFKLQRERPAGFVLIENSESERDGAEYTINVGTIRVEVSSGLL